jgi:hypothetical protein
MKHVSVVAKDGSFAGWIVVGDSMREEIVKASPTLQNYVGDRWSDFQITAKQNEWAVAIRDQAYDRG